MYTLRFNSTLFFLLASISCCISLHANNDDKKTSSSDLPEFTNYVTLSAHDRNHFYSECSKLIDQNKIHDVQDGIKKLIKKALTPSSKSIEERYHIAEIKKAVADDKKRQQHLLKFHYEDEDEPYEIPDSIYAMTSEEKFFFSVFSNPLLKKIWRTNHALRKKTLGNKSLLNFCLDQNYSEQCTLELAHEIDTISLLTIEQEIEKEYTTSCFPHKTLTRFLQESITNTRTSEYPNYDTPGTSSPSYSRRSSI